MNTPTAVMLTLSLIGVVILVVTLACGLFADFTVQAVIRKQSGGGGDSAGGDDADIIKMANEGQREEAARLYVGLHGGSLAQARKVVGSGTVLQRLALILGVIVLSFILIVFCTSTQCIPLATIWCANVFLITALWMKSRRQIARNRKTIAQGTIPAAAHE